jgi:hypothetical protein
VCLYTTEFRKKKGAARAATKLSKRCREEV